MVDDWYTKPGKVEKGIEFSVLDPAVWYTLKLVDISFQTNVTRQFKGDTRTADEITTVWDVEGTTAKVWQRFTYSWNMKSNLVRFINQMGYLLREGQVGTLAAYFTLDPPARIQCRLIPREKDGQPTGYYSIDMNTVRGVDVPPPGPAPAPAPAAATPPQKPESGMTPEQAQEVDRIIGLLQQGKFSVKSQALNALMAFANVTDGSLFAVAWSRYEKDVGPALAAGR